MICAKRAKRFCGSHCTRKKLLQSLDSLKFTVLLLSLVVACIVVDALGPDDGMSERSAKIFNYTAWSIFTVEVLTRMALVGDMKKFFGNVYSTIDFTVMLVDVFSVAGEYLFPEQLSYDGTETRALKALRFIRLGRILRVLRLAREIRDKILQPTEPEYDWVMPEKYTKV